MDFKENIIVGIDPGVKTGMAIWNCKKQGFIFVGTSNIVSAMSTLRVQLECYELDELRFEDARLRKWFGNSGREKLQGAGSIKRDSAIWEEFCKYYKIPFQAVKPSAGNTKWKADYFKRLTGWEKRTSEHSRDAAALVFGLKNIL